MFKTKHRALVSFAFLVVIFGSLLTPLFRPQHAHASDEWGVLNNLGGSSSDGAKGNAAMKKLKDAVTVTFNNAGSIHLELNIQDPLFNLNVSNKSWHDYYSGDYVWGQDPDENWGYTFGPVDTSVKLSNDDPVSVLAFIKPQGKQPLPGASAAEVTNWANHLQVYFGLVRYTGHGADEQYEYFVDVKNNGDANGDWWKYFNTLGEDFATTDGDSGASLQDSFTSGRSKTDNMLVRYVFNNGVIQAVKADNQAAENYSITNSSTVGFYFKPSNSGKDSLVLYNDNWKTIAPSQAQVLALFDTDQNVTVTAHTTDNETSTILVAGGKSSAALATATATKTGALGSAGGDQNVTCETSGGTNLGWILCPIINGSLDGAQAIFHKFIEPLLLESPISTDATANNPIMTIWKSFRTIGNILLIFALLFVVFGQSIGGGLVDAYTAKKTIPRILVAAVLINLSIYICAIIVDIFNVLGAGVARLIISPLKDNGQLKVQPDGSGSWLVGIGSILAIALAFFVTKWTFFGHDKAKGSLGPVLQYLLVFIVLPILLAIFGIFVTLLIRRAIILMLVIVSPLAMAAFAVPNADKYAKKWLDAFIKTMLVYPIITGIFGISQVLAVVMFAAGDSSDVVTILATLIIAFAPLFMIPFAFKLAGGLIGGLAGSIKSGRDNLKKVWGDDKHNPYSRRVKMKDEVRGHARGRMISGVAGGNSNILKRFNSVRQANENLRASKASGVASAATETHAGGIGGAKVEEAKDFASKEATKSALGLPSEQAEERAAWVGEAAGLGFLNHGNNTATGSAGSAAARTAAIDPAATKEEVLAAGSGSAEAEASGIYTPQQVQAIGAGTAAFYRARGRAPNATEKAAIWNASVAAHTRSGSLGRSPDQTQAAIRGAARGAGMAVGSGDARVSGAAAAIGAISADAAADAFNRGVTLGKPTPLRKAAEAEASDAAATVAIRNAMGEAGYDHADAAPAAGGSAAEAVYDGRSNPALSGQEAARVIVTGVGGLPEAAAAGKNIP